MKTEFRTGTLQEITHWLNDKAFEPPKDHIFVSHVIEEYPQGLLAQAVFYTPEELEEAKDRESEQGSSRD